MLLKYFLLWLPMIFIAVLNGSARDLWYKKHTGELTGHQVSTVSLIILFGFYITAVLKKYPPNSATQSMQIGLLWLVLTLLFEFGLGLMRGQSWELLLQDYNVFKGRIWILIPIWVTVAPYLFYKMFP
ncbi:hypothetical protein [Flavobacterium sp. J49]|uniref:hypothetical protein n=1 Tax=Flavobacterium sp. J49 TaxID=2718534 RepID=UPI001C3D845E|nr:hypothetical protein [Flavobacterium sp. J49]